MIYKTVMADPPWKFTNSTGKMAPQHQRLFRYETLSVEAICRIPVNDLTEDESHLYLWVPNAFIQEGLTVLSAWGFTYKTMLIWEKIRKDGYPDGRGVGFYFRNVTEVLLFGIKGKIRTLDPGRRQVNLFREQKREHSRKPEAAYKIIEQCSPGPFLELFYRYKREGWTQLGEESGWRVPEVELC